MFGFVEKNEQRRLAFVLGNGAYRNFDPPLGNPENDRREIAAALGRLGFRVSGGTDLEQTAIRSEITRFCAAIRKDDVALFYYSGHGVQIDETNYLVPIDADMASETFVDELVSLQDVVSRMSSTAAVTLVFLDACRNNPVDARLNEQRERIAGAKGLPLAPVRTGRGLAKFETSAAAGGGPTFIAFAAGPGKEAYERDGGVLSIFTDGLMQHIETTDLTLDHLMMRVAGYVRSETQQEQEPWISSSLPRPFRFTPGSLVWFNANLIAFAAFVTALLGNAIVSIGQAGAFYVAAITAAVILALIIFLHGLGRSYQFVRGEYRDEEDDRWWRDAIGGYLGALFAGMVITASYHLGWDPEYGSPDPFGRMLAEITVAAALAGVALGPASHHLARRFAGRHPPGRRRNVVTVAGAILGGVLAGAVIGPPVTLYFGLYPRPPVTALTLLPGGLFGATALVFSILTYNVQRTSYRRMARDFLAALKGTACVSAVVAVVFAAIAYPLNQAVGAVLETTHWPTLLLIGLPLGITVGIVLGAAVGATLVFTDRAVSPDAGGVRSARPAN